jgi:hypothetical protein
LTHELPRAWTARTPPGAVAFADNVVTAVSVAVSDAPPVPSPRIDARHE